MSRDNPENTLGAWFQIGGRVCHSRVNWLTRSVICVLFDTFPLHLSTFQAEFDDGCVSQRGQVASELCIKLL